MQEAGDSAFSWNSLPVADSRNAGHGDQRHPEDGALDPNLTYKGQNSIFLPRESQFFSPIARSVYGANGVSWMPDAEARANMPEDDLKYADYATMMEKTHLSQSVPKNWTLPIWPFGEWIWT